MATRIASTLMIFCEACDRESRSVWFAGKPLICLNCNGPAMPVEDVKYGEAPGLMTDDIPGGIEIRHGLVDENGNPRKFYSLTEIKRAANEAGLKIGGDTPGKPYPVQWSGIKKEPEKIAPIIKQKNAEA